VPGIADIGDRSRPVANQIDVVAPDAPLRNLPVARAVLRPAPDLRTATEAWLTAGGPHHTVLSTALTSEHLRDFAEMTRTELALIGLRHPDPAFHPGTAPEPGLSPARQRAVTSPPPT